MTFNILRKDLKKMKKVFGLSYVVGQARNDNNNKQVFIYNKQQLMIIIFFIIISLWLTFLTFTVTVYEPKRMNRKEYQIKEIYWKFFTMTTTTNNEQWTCLCVYCGFTSQKTKKNTAV